MMEKITSLSKRRGFVYPSSEIYGGVAGIYDYGHYGALLKENIKNECEPQIESSRNLHAMAERIHPVILVVDDDEFQHKIISKILAGTNYQLIFASSGIQALSILRKTKPDVILMDIMMPEMDGMEVTRMIRTMSTFENTPVIMITGNSEGDTVVNSIKSGATDFLVKPFNRDSLIAKILHALNTKILPDS